MLVRIVGQAPLAATVYSLERLRCGACGQVFTAQEPEGVGPEKYDETAPAMIAQLKYGSGTPFYRLEQLEGQLGIPLPAAAQWEIVEEAAELIKPARDEMIRQAAQGEVVHNDDTSMRVLRLAREPSDERTGVFTSGIVRTASPTPPVWHSCNMKVVMHPYLWELAVNQRCSLNGEPEKADPNLRWSGIAGECTRWGPRRERGAFP